jgi:hypothetical protein
MGIFGNSQSIDISPRNGRIPPNMFIQLSVRRTRRSKLPLFERLEVFDLTGAIQDRSENVN